VTDAIPEITLFLSFPGPAEAALTESGYRRIVGKSVHCYRNCGSVRLYQI